MLLLITLYKILVKQDVPPGEARQSNPHFHPLIKSHQLLQERILTVTTTITNHHNHQERKFIILKNNLAISMVFLQSLQLHQVGVIIITVCIQLIEKVSINIYYQNLYFEYIKIKKKFSLILTVLDNNYFCFDYIFYFKIIYYLHF